MVHYHIIIVLHIILYFMLRISLVRILYVVYVTLDHSQLIYQGNNITHCL